MIIKPNKRFERDDPPASIACRHRATLVARYKELLTRFSNKEKLRREKWVVRQLLGALSISFKEEMTEAAEPVDVAFRDARFQVKEILDKGRRRTDEFKNKLERIEQAQDNSGLLEEYTPQDISFTEIVQRCYSYAELISQSKYGPQECKNIDLLCYFNWRHHFSMVPPTEVLTKEVGFRSLSVVSNRYCAVVYASPNAPALLRDNVGKVAGGAMRCFVWR